MSENPWQKGTFQNMPVTCSVTGSESSSVRNRIPRNCALLHAAVRRVSQRCMHIRHRCPQVPRTPTFPRNNRLPIAPLSMSPRASFLFRTFACLELSVRETGRKKRFSTWFTITLNSRISSNQLKPTRYKLVMTKKACDLMKNQLTIN